MTQRDNDLQRIESALRAAAETLSPFTPGAIAVEMKAGGDPVTEADRRVDGVLRRMLPEEGEGWLSEETVDDLARLDYERVWVVDPLDGTREFIEGIPEWSVSIGLVDQGQPVAGGIYNPSTDQLVLGATDRGVTLNGKPARVRRKKTLEVKRGEWDRFLNRGFEVKPCGSVAYKLAQVAAGLVDATWTLVPKNEWDVVAGVALVRAAGGHIEVLEDPDRTFNREDPLMAGMLAHPPSLDADIRREINL
jgi:myo-inositol-1(or 4)-monophosphatase